MIFTIWFLLTYSQILQWQNRWRRSRLRVMLIPCNLWPLFRTRSRLKPAYLLHNLLNPTVSQKSPCSLHSFINITYTCNGVYCWNIKEFVYFLYLFQYHVFYNLHLKLKSNCLFFVILFMCIFYGFFIFNKIHANIKLACIAFLF